MLEEEDSQAPFSLLPKHLAATGEGHWDGCETSLTQVAKPALSAAVSPQYISRMGGLCTTQCHRHNLPFSMPSKMRKYANNMKIRPLRLSARIAQSPSMTEVLSRT